MDMNLVVAITKLENGTMLACRDTNVLKTKVDISFGHHGELIIITDPKAYKSLGIKPPEKSYQNSEFITLHKSDAENILSMLNQAIANLESGTRSDNDVEVFGERAISYERLIDRLDGSIIEDDAETQFSSWKEYGDSCREYTQRKDDENE